MVVLRPSANQHRIRWLSQGIMGSASPSGSTANSSSGGGKPAMLVFTGRRKWRKQKPKHAPGRSHGHKLLLCKTDLHWLAGYAHAAVVATLASTQACYRSALAHQKNSHKDTRQISTCQTVGPIPGCWWQRVKLSPHLYAGYGSPQLRGVAQRQPGHAQDLRNTFPSDPLSLPRTDRGSRISQ